MLKLQIDWYTFMYHTQPMRCDQILSILTEWAYILIHSSLLAHNTEHLFVQQWHHEYPENSSSDNTHTHTRAHTRTHAHTHTRTRTRTRTRTHTRIEYMHCETEKSKRRLPIEYIYIPIECDVCVCVCVCVCVYVCMYISVILAAKLDRSILLTATSILIHLLPLDFSRGYVNCLIDEIVYLVGNHKIQPWVD